MNNSIFRTKPLEQLLRQTSEEENRLRRSLGAWDLVAIGIGCIIGVGIFVLPGVEASVNAGPGIILSFLIAAAACACSALSYAELASMIPVAGSTYTYGYATLGEIFAWIIGWDLLLEYGVGASVVAIGWSAYFVNLMNNALAPLHLSIPASLSASPWSASPGTINTPSIVVVMVITWLLVIGIRESAAVNRVIVILKLAVIFFFVAISLGHVDSNNWRPFIPFGFHGVLRASAIVFLAYVGFDAVATTAEEAVAPQRDMPVGILGSLLLSTFLYILVAAVMTGAVSYKRLNVADPIALVLNVLNMQWASAVVSLGALAGMTSVLLVLLMGQSRILFAMSRDRLLPPAFSRIHKRHRTPYITTLITGSAVAVAAGLLPISLVAELASIGTLFAYVIASAGVLVLRYKKPDIPRTFKTPFFPYTPSIGILLCLFLMAHLPLITWYRFLIWLVIGLFTYRFYGYGRARSAC